MVLILMILLKGKNGKGRKHVEKSFNTNFLPSKDYKIEDSAWKEEREIVNITINYKDNNCIVELLPDVNNYDLKEKVEMYLSHSWVELT
ncbi:MAG: hypothetical protein P9L97_08380 [Candidatus Tenebribacter davisii]|nr:hypothetical protein [Candidatus Tenebribacter davisii]